MRRVLLLAIVGLATAFIGTGTAFAEVQNGTAGGSTNGTGGQVTVSAPGGSAPGGPGGTGRAPGKSDVECRYFSVASNAGAALPSVGVPITDTSTLMPGAYVWLICRDANSGVMTYENLFTWNPTDPPVATPPALVLAQMAANTLNLPLPGVETWPPAGSEALVNMAVWLHVANWAAVSASASVGGLTATVTAVPVRVVWDMVDGSVTCGDAGSVYGAAVGGHGPGSSDCSYTYRQGSGDQPNQTFHDSATITWHLAWSATNGQAGDLGDLTGPAAAFGLRIEESQALVSGTGQWAN